MLAVLKSNHMIGDVFMFIQFKKIVVTEGNTDQVVKSLVKLEL